MSSDYETRMKMAQLAKCACTILGALSLSGCIVIGNRDKFEYLRQESVDEGSFVPSIALDHTPSRTYLPFFRIDLERPPYDLVMHLYEPENRESTQTVASVVVDQLKIESEVGGIVSILSNDMPKASRTFKVAHELKNGATPFAKRFTASLKNRESFKIFIEGYAVRRSGERLPFHQVNTYRYEGNKWTCWSLFQEWSGV